MPPTARRAHCQAPAELASATRSAANASASGIGSKSRIRSNDRAAAWLARRTVTTRATTPATVPKRRSFDAETRTEPAWVAKAGAMLDSSVDRRRLRKVDEFEEESGVRRSHTHPFGQGRTNPGSGSVTSPRQAGERPPRARRLPRVT